MMKLLLTITCLISCCAAPVFAEDEDPIAKKVAAAKETFYADRDKAEKQLLELMTRRENTAKQAGDLKNLEAIRAEIAAFRSEGTLPKIVSPKDYETAMKLAKTKLENAYTAGIKNYTQAEKLDEAKQIQSLLDELKAGAPAANAKAEFNDPFVPNSVWVNEKQTQFITVRERKNDTFTANYTTFVNGKRHSFNVKGTIKDGKFEWLGKDAIDTEGNDTKYHSSGVISKDPLGDRIDFSKKWSDEHLKFVLRPKQK